MHQLTINLPPDLYAFVQKIAARETRPVSLQIRHFIAEAARRAGNPTAEREPWPPVLPPVTRENLPDAKAEIAAWTVERDGLARRECETGGRSLRPDEQNRLAWLRDSIKTQQVRVDMLEGRPSSEPRRPGRPNLGGSHG
jgi:hypothetical protein